MGDIELTLEDVDELITGTTPEEYRASFDALPEETREAIKQLKRDYQVLGRDDSPESFAVFFKHMEGVPLEDFALEAVREAYLAHEQDMGSLHEWFRESGKTTVFTKNFLLYRIAKEPHKTNMLIRINDDKANETALAIANIIENNPKWQELYPNIIPDKEMGWGARGYYVRDTSVSGQKWAKIRKETYPTFVGYGWKSGSIIGSRISGCCIVDDIHDAENTMSDRELARIKRFYVENLSNCIMDGAWELWNFTLWSFNDIYSDLRSNKRRYIHNWVPVIKPAEENAGELWEKDEDIPYSGKRWHLTTPERWPFRRVAQKYLTRTEGDEYIANAFERQYLLDLRATMGINLKGEWLHQYPADDINTSWPVFFGIDYASTPDKLKHRERDYFALAIARAIPGGGIVIVDGYRRHITRPEALDLVIGLWSQFPTLQRIGVETIGTGEEFYTDLMMLTDVMGRPPPLMSIKHGRKNKGDRFEGWLAPRFKNSQIWIADPLTSFLREFRNEWMLWPNAQHDDCLDAVYMVAQAAQYMMPSKAEKAFRKRRKPSPWAELVRS